MSAQTRPCPTCRGETTAQPIDSMSGHEHPLQVTVRGMTVQRCAAGHTHFVAIDFPLTVLKHLVDEDEAALPAGEKKGLIFKHFHCQDCHQELAAKPDHRHTFSVQVALEGVDPFGVDLEMPVYRCPGCGKEQLHSLDEIREHTPAALAQAFQDGGIAREA